MWRSVSVLLVVVTIASSSLRAADKREAPAETQARDLVKQALLAESQGDNDQRSKYFREAWLSVPDLAEANWHMARIRVGQHWQPLAEAVSAATQSPDEATYRQLRDKAGSPRQLRELARWCDKHGWTDRARLHYAQILASPKADESYKSEAVEKLDLVQVNGQWFTSEEVKVRKAEAEAIQDSLIKWRPKLKALQQLIDGPDFAKRDKAIKELSKLDDPTMIPALESFLLDAKADFQEQVVKKLAEFKHYEATEALVRYAVLSDYSITRSAAVAALKERPQHEYVPLLLGGLLSPIKAQYQVVWNARGDVRYIHAFQREGATSNQLLVTHQLANPIISGSKQIDDSAVKIVPRGHPSKLVLDEYSKIGSVEQAKKEQRAEAALRALNTETELGIRNRETESNNRPLFDVLEKTSGQALERSPSVWWRWWQEHNGYSYPKPTQFLYASRSFQYSAQEHTQTKLSGTMYRPPGSCFLAGTPVRTERGAVPIEAIQPGDRVLAQDQDTGELTYKVVLKTTLRPPAKMLRIAAGNDEVVTTLGHPFWVSGHGWKMAKELKAGDLLHTLGGAVKIESVNPAGEERAHNLVVDDFNTYFVGQAGCLVHDNQFRKPTQATVPGLIQ